MMSSHFFLLQPVTAGSEVLIDSEAHPGGSFPWINAQNRRGIVLRAFPVSWVSSRETLKAIESLTTEHTKVISVSHITAPTGTLMPLREIAAFAKARGIWFHVDGAQAAGQVPIDLAALAADGVDSYAASLHKWSGAVHGTGFLWVRKDRLPEVIPCEAGAYSDAPGGSHLYPGTPRLEYNTTAVRFEYGTRTMSLPVAAGAALAKLEELGMAVISARGHGLATALHSGLAAIPQVTVLTPADESMRASMITFKVQDIPYDELYQFLMAEPYKCRCRIVTELGLDAIRVSLHIFNFERDVENVLTGVKAAIAKQKGGSMHLMPPV
jgi:selenocysteine lyase/cysteine desulfurase